MLTNRTAPRWLARMITGRYGRTPFGEPRYRMVWAAARLERCGGEWVDWDAGLSTAERLEGTQRAWRRTVQLRWVPKYPGEECWLIERWLPAASYGTPEQWYAPAGLGGTMLRTSAGAVPGCGEYPWRGDYEDIGARMYWYPTEHHVTLAINAVERGRQAMPATAWGRALRRTFQAQQAQEKREREYATFCHEVLGDADQAFGGAPMVGYGGSRRPSAVELCERIGIREHPI